MIQINLSHLLIIAGLVVLAYMLNALSAILLPFVLGFALAYFLDPLADRLEDIGLRRSLATFTITFTVALGLLPAVVFGLPALAGQITMLVGNVPGYVSEMQNWLATQNLDAGQTEIVNSLSEALLSGLQATASGLLLSGLSLINLISLMFITPIVAIYMLNDWDRMVARVDHYSPMSSPRRCVFWPARLTTRWAVSRGVKVWSVWRWGRFTLLACGLSGLKAR